MNELAQRSFLRWAGVFLFVNSVILTLSPAVRERSWDVDYRLAHWVGFLCWVAIFSILHRAISKRLPESDPYLLPAAALLSGWGLLTVWRLDSAFGFRQTIWLAISAAAFFAALQTPPNPILALRRYKYVLLVGGLLITALTLFFGSNPMGAGPRLWLGCCGVYIQPSEPLKLLLTAYLAAYLADRAPFSVNALKGKSASGLGWEIIAPTLAVTGAALLLLVVQRDLGTASIFILLLAIVLFLAVGKKRVLSIALVSLSLALAVGYFFVSVIRIRVDGWLNPWNDPAGASYQIVQSLLAVANGGLLGRGLGIGSPLLVPVAISDFIFAAVAEEHGLLGALGLLAVMAIILTRGIIAALRAPDTFRRYLSAGATAYLGVQSLLIIGGNLRLLPLTGVTLPFVSYGGSSLLTSFAALYILITVSAHEDDEPAPLSDPKPYATLAGLLLLGLFVSALAGAWWAIFRAPDLLSRTDNARRAIADRYVPRGNLLDRNNQPINVTQGESGSYYRAYLYPDLAPVTGYTQPVYGQAGLEASLDDYLRGYRGNPSSLIWWNHFLYGAPPPGLDVRLSLSLSLQSKADELLGKRAGALILMNAQTGEILAMASHPTYDPNRLDEEGDSLAQDKSSPLLNRAAQGLYPLGNFLDSLLKGKADYRALRLFEAPKLNMPLDFGKARQEEPRVSPLQLSLIAAALSHDGIKPAPRIATALNSPAQGWVTLALQSEPIQIMSPETARQVSLNRMIKGKPYWRYTAEVKSRDEKVVWLAAGTLPDWGGAPLALIVALEDDNAWAARSIGENLLDAAINR